MRSASRCSSTRSPTRCRAGATESTVLGPFYSPGAPLREYGANLGREARRRSGLGARARARRRGEADRRRRARRVAERRRHALRRPGAGWPDEHLRGRFRTRDGRELRVPCGPARAVPDPRRWASRADAGSLRAASLAPRAHPPDRAGGRAPHARDSHLRRGRRVPDSDAVFAVKPSLLRTFVPHDGGRSRDARGRRCALVLARERHRPGTRRRPAEPRDPGRTA